MSNVPTNLIPSTITQLPEYDGSSTLGYFPYSLGGRTYKVQFSNLAAVGAVPSTRTIATGNGLQGGGDLSQNRTISIISHGVGYAQLDFTGVVAGTYGSADTIPAITVDDTGRVTSVVDTPVVLADYVPSSRTVTAGAGLTGGGQLNGNITISLNPSNSTPLSLGVASAGTGSQAARDDHVHPAVNLTDTSETQGTLPLGRGGTGVSLSPVLGAVIYADNDSLNQTPAGNLGQVLTSAGGLGAPYWQTITGIGTVTSVDISGGTTGLTTSGGPVVTAGTITLGGVLNVANGGTGAATAVAARSNLSAAKSGANTDITSVALTTGTISTSPTADTDIANKIYVDNLYAAGVNYHQAVKYEVPNTTGNLNATYNNGTAGVGATLTNAGTLGAFTPDGVVASVGDRILIYNQTNAAQNGVYVVTTVGNGSTAWVLTRSSDTDTYGKTSPTALGQGDAFYVTSGNSGAGETYICTTSGTITFGTTPITFAQISAAQVYSAGTGLTLSGTTFSITNTGVTAASYGSASSVPVLSINAQGQVTSASSSSIAIAASQITSGNLPITYGGTGAGNAAAAFNNLSPITSTGDLIIGNGANSATRLGIGANGYILTSNGTTAAWGPAPSSMVYPGAGIAVSTGSAWGTSFNNSTNPISVSYGGTGATTLTSGYLVKGNGTSAVSASVVYDNGTNVGIGTSSPGAKLNVVDASVNDALRITQTGTGNALVVEDSANPDSTPFVIFADGRSAQGHTSSLNFTGASYLSEALGYGSVFPFAAGYTGASATGARIALVKNRSADWSTNAIVQSGDTLGELAFTGADGSDYVIAARIIGSVDGTPGVADMPGRLVFQTTPDSGSIPAERMRIDSAGNVGINAAPQAWGANFKGIEGYGASTFFLSGNSVNGITTVGNSYQNGTNWVYTTTGAAARYQVGTTTAPHIWSYAASGTAGATVTWSEALRIGPAGQIGLGGANYGTSGQILTSNGSGSAPTWQNAPATGVTQARATALSMILGF